MPNGFGIYRNVMRRVGLGLEGGRVLTKGRLRSILQDEDRCRVLVNQLSTVGRSVRSARTVGCGDRRARLGNGWRSSEAVGEAAAEG